MYIHIDDTIKDKRQKAAAKDARARKDTAKIYSDVRRHHLANIGQLRCTAKAAKDLDDRSHCHFVLQPAVTWHQAWHHRRRPCRHHAMSCRRHVSHRHDVRHAVPAAVRRRRAVVRHAVQIY